MLQALFRENVTNEKKRAYANDGVGKVLREHFRF